MISIRSVAALLGLALLAACEKNEAHELTASEPQARIKFFNFGVNAPSVNFYANDDKVSAVLSSTGTEATTGTNSGIAASGGFYSSLAPGQYSFTGRIAAATDKDLAISTVPATLEDGKSYSLYISGIYNTTAKTVEGFVVEDPFIPEFDFDVTYVRFVNAISNSSPMTLYVKRQPVTNPDGTTQTFPEVAVGAAVAYKGAGVFVALPPGSYDLATRTTGSSTNAISRTAVSFTGRNVYTVGARGDITVSTSGTSAARPQLDVTANR